MDYKVELLETVHMHAKVEGKVKEEGKRPSKHRYVIEFEAGDDLHKDSGKWMNKVKVINRREDDYLEVITDPETGEKVHECHEPLRQHQGHGSAKPKK